MPPVLKSSIVTPAALAGPLSTMDGNEVIGVVDMMPRKIVVELFSEMVPAEGPPSGP